MVDEEGQLLNQPDEVAKLLFERSIDADFSLPVIKTSDRIRMNQDTDYTM